MFRGKNLKISVLLIFAFTLCIFFSPKLKAAVISPDKYYIDIANNNQPIHTLTIYSIPNQEKDITYSIKPIGIKKVGVENQRTFYSPDGVDIQDASNWVQVLDPQVTVSPNSTVEVRWTISIPDNYTCETKIAGLAVAEVNTTQDGSPGAQVSINNEVISQIHINTTRSDDTSCKYYEDLILQEFTTTQSIPIYNYDNISFKTSIENRSDYLSKNIRGFIEIFGIGEKEVIEFNDTNLDIYPHSIRNFDNVWLDSDYPRGDFIQETIYELTHFKFGIYNVRLGITKNVQTPIISNIKIFIIPVRVIVLFLLLLITVILVIRNNYKTHKELKRLKEKHSVKIVKRL